MNENKNVEKKISENVRRINDLARLIAEKKNKGGLYLSSYEFDKLYKGYL